MQPEIKGHDVAAKAREARGAPFRHQGRDLRGFDCKGLVEWVAAQLELIPAGYVPLTNYGRFPGRALVATELDKWMERVHGGLREAGEGDVLLIEDRRWATHLAILARAEIGANRLIIHATSAERQVVEHQLTADWIAKVRGVWRFKGVIIEPWLSSR